MSSGSSVFSIIPPKRARIERFILVQSPISAHPPTAKCESSNVGGAGPERGSFGHSQRSLVRHIRSGSFMSGKLSSEYNSTVRSLPHITRNVPEHDQCHAGTAFPANEFSLMRHNKGRAQQAGFRRLT